MLSSKVGAQAPESHPMASGYGEDPKRQIKLRSELALGRVNLHARFHNSPPHVLRSGELLVTSTASSPSICLIRAGWACQFCDLGIGGTAIIGVYLPGDIIGLDAVLGPRRLEVRTLTSVTVELIPGNSLIELMACQSTALYVIWLFSQQQQRTDQLLAARLHLVARGRLAMMFFDFYKRLRRHRLIAGSIYNLPLTQAQIGSYLGLTAVDMNRALRSLRDEGIVEVEKHCVTILDPEQLSRLAQPRGSENSISA